MRISDWSSDVCSSDLPAGTLRKSGGAALTLGALGVVYGDIGTSPLYTIKEVFGPLAGVPLDGPNIVGAVSVILWALVLVVTLKYVLLILRADHHGEGGILALASLARSEEHTSELQSLMRISYAVFCLKKNITSHDNT